MVGLQRLEEIIELGRLRNLSVSAGVNLRSLGVRFAPDLLHLAVGVRLDFVEIAVTLACNPRRFTVPFGTKALGDLKSLADHALVDAVEDIRVVVDSLDPEIEYRDAKLRQFLRGSCFDFLFDLLAPEFDGWQDADRAGGTALEGIVVDRLAVLIGTHDFDKVVFGDGVTGFAA